MKTNSILLILLTMLSMIACKSDKIQKSENESDEISELSIFQINTSWRNQNNEEIKFIDLKGNVLVAVMIYTSCKAACPRLVADMNSICDKLGKKSNKNIKYILVSIDPETDTPERLNKFAKENFMTEDHWVFLSGTVDEVRDFANVVAVKYKEISPIDFSHSNIISVFDQKGVMVHQQEGLGVDNKETVNKIIELAQ